MTTNEMFFSIGFACLVLVGLPAACAPKAQASIQPVSAAAVVGPEEAFCKRLAKVAFTAVQMRDAEDTEKETRSYVDMMTQGLRDDTREMLTGGIVPALYRPDAEGLAPVDAYDNLFSNCMGRVDPAVTYSPTDQ